MLESAKDISIFSGKVRVRVCGLLQEEEKILFIKHDSIGSGGLLWVPPGGGVSFGETLETALHREFLEETGLEIEVQNFLFAFEMIDEKHHALEMFYKVKKIGGNLALGKDPELEDQIMSELRFLSFDQIANMDRKIIHGIFNEVKFPEMVFGLKGLFSFKH